MDVGKWDYKTKEYNDYILPKGSVIYTSDMEEMVICAQCGKEAVFGDMYTSRELHTKGIGLAVAVCENCYAEERERECKKDKDE